jgi:phosphate transport system substrate-binding protein
MKKHLMMVLGIVLSGVLLITMPSAPAEPPQSVVRVSGADSMMDKARVLSRVFMHAHPAIKVDLQGGLVDVGIAALLNKQSDVALASRRLTPEEEQLAIKNGIELLEYLIGYGGIVILVNPQNQVNELTVEQVQKILKGTSARWNEVGGRDEFITVVTIDESKHPGTLIFMREDVLGGAPFAKDAVTVSDFPSVMKKVSDTPGAIGFARIRDTIESFAAEKEKTKMLKIRKSAAFAGVAPSREAVDEGSYPLRRPYYVYVDSKAGSDIQKFVDFIVKKGWIRQDP